MAVPPIESEDANKIARAEFVSDSAWHVHAALSWLGYSLVKDAPTSLHYSAMHLRLGIEHLWFDIFVASQGASISMQEYEKALSSSTKLYKMIDSLSPNYRKFVDFVHMTNEFDSTPPPPSIAWDIDRLKRIHGETSERLLHFGGVPAAGFRDTSWISSQVAFLKEHEEWMWHNMTTRGNLVVYRPDGLQKPEVFSIWNEFSAGTLDHEGVRIRLKILQPLLKHRRDS